MKSKVFKNYTEIYKIVKDGCLICKLFIYSYISFLINLRSLTLYLLCK